MISQDREMPTAWEELDDSERSKVNRMPSKAGIRRSKFVYPQPKREAPVQAREALKIHVVRPGVVVVTRESEAVE